jgi:HSP20 family protein
MMTSVRTTNGALKRDERTWPGFQGFVGFDAFQRLQRAWQFDFDVTRTESGYALEVPVPGFNSGNVEITLKDGIVSIEGKTERRSFSRSFTVPEDVDVDKIDAKVVDGILTLSLERKAEAQPRRISVN